MAFVNHTNSEPPRTAQDRPANAIVATCAGAGAEVKTMAHSAKSERSYSVYYRTESGKWARLPQAFFWETAKEQVRQYETEGFKAHYALTSELDQIGLPDDEQVQAGA